MALYTLAQGINDNGQIVGSYTRSAVGPRYHGFLLSSGVFTTLDASTGNFDTEASGINNGLEIVGHYFDASGVHGFFRSGDRYITLDHPSATGGTVAAGINNFGLIVGFTPAPASTTASF